MFELTIGVYYWNEVEVVVVDKRRDVGVLAIAGDELICQVFDCHRGDPFAGVDGAGEESELSGRM